MRLVEPCGWPEIVAVVGGGRMGSGIAEALLAGGVTVRITDASPELSVQARQRVIDRTRSHVAAGLIDAELIQRAERVTACDSVAKATWALGWRSSVALPRHALVQPAGPVSIRGATGSMTRPVAVV